MANLVQLGMLERLDAFLLVDKPVGLSFATVVKSVKRKFNLVKVGHGGSLDAFASGLLVLLINDANKFVGDVMGADRTYEGVLRLGLATNTGDIHGERTGGGDAAAVTAESLAAAAREFTGDIFQTESRFCSIRREGSADYAIADTGEHAPFMAHVYRLTFGEISAPDAEGFRRVPFALSCTKGVVPRMIASDLGTALGCGAVLESLRRLKVGKHDVADAVPFDRLLETDIKDFTSCVMPLTSALR